MEAKTNKKDQTKKSQRGLKVSYIAIAHAVDRLQGLLQLLQEIPENGAPIKNNGDSKRRKETMPVI
jgi:hypothetical protein